ncbi:unnamed protein product [Rotaria sp. Silwood2]|nr:unnamed protein product [Rotaria sp. Silwood2]CAF2574425.1 unnamed protein product [Rotaria sp. Silwood2]CAF2966819.1 unnamed protein product [Rotaria sp. Silwood2]CAF3948851.1 unnamed protein product [Rotaria sp. Silwood2]CAF4143237.1 unnamed protein product [Rotaria sp. Silwood2]
MDSYQHQYDFSVHQAVKKWRTLTANDGILLEQEFNTLRNMDQNRITIATNPVNKSKNRYPLVYPCQIIEIFLSIIYIYYLNLDDEDFCRVSLKKKIDNQSNDNSDYINASIIRCIPPDQITTTPISRIIYAAQGPTEQTIDDFIQMIIEQQITVIVMLSFSYDPITCTYAQEHAAYFSEKVNAVIETKFYKIRTTAIIPAYRYIGRRLRIKSKLTDSVYNCEQYHYPHFIDKSIPVDCHSIISLVMRLLEPNNQNCRILVHCSAGIGRTGVFIAVYYLIEAFAHRYVLNVKQLVDTIRFYRAHLVQTVEQYEFIYRCLAEVAIHPCDGRSLDKFIEYCNNLLPTARLEDSTIYYNFKNRTTSIEPDTYLTTIMAQQHSNYNRNQLFIPYDYNRVILHSPSESMYINATRVTNIIRPNGTILTQEPMKSTLQPFFSMLLQEYKTFVVAVEQMEKSNYTESQFISQNEIKVDSLSVNPSKNKFGDYYRSHKIKVKYSDIRESDVLIFEYTGEWTSDGTCLPNNLEQFVRFVDRSIYHQRKIDLNRCGLVVHDRGGGTKAAFYCIVQNLFDRLLIDGRVAIENFVTFICQQRINALVSLEQYIALHQIVCIWHNLKRRGALECTVNI